MLCKCFCLCIYVVFTVFTWPVRKHPLVMPVTPHLSCFLSVFWGGPKYMLALLSGFLVGMAGLPPPRVRQWAYNNGISRLKYLYNRQQHLFYDAQIFTISCGMTGGSRFAGFWGRGQLMQEPNLGYPQILLSHRIYATYFSSQPWHDEYLFN